MNRTFDWKPPAGGPDPRNWQMVDHPIWASLEANASLIAGPVLWLCPAILDQLQTGMCVGFGWTDLAQSSPNPKVIVPGAGYVKGSTPERIYDLAQQYDGSPLNPNTGASVESGAKATRDYNFIRTYRFAKTVHEIAVTVLSYGPVVMGTNWYNGMFTPDAHHRIRPTGTVAGGHCWVIRGYDRNSGLFRLRNSWGKSWGADGDAFISGPDLTKLLSEQGEACVPSKI
jgi:hypothetical protein